jgi:hypothetical protein
MSCACCGLDGSWSESIIEFPGYPSDVISRLDLYGGSFDDGMRAEFWIEIKKVELINNRYIFKTDIGDIFFRFNKRISHRISDITFITNKNYKYASVAEIYREIILSGTLDIPHSIIDRAKIENLSSSQNAKMVFQGFGNMCVNESDFKKWLIKIEDVNFTGSGQIKE